MTITPSVDSLNTATMHGASNPDGVNEPRAADAPDRAFGQILTHRIENAAPAANAPEKSAAQPDAKADVDARPQDAKAPRTPADTNTAKATTLDEDHELPPTDATAHDDLTAQMALAAQWSGHAANVATKAVCTDATNDGKTADLSATSAPTVPANVDLQLAASPHASTARKAAPVGDARVSMASEILRSATDATMSMQPAPTTPLPEALSGARAIDLALHTTALPSAMASTMPTLAQALQQPVGTPGWSQEVGHAVLRMAANEMQSATISINPEHLGPMDVRIRVEDGTAHLAFNVAHADTRHALESSRNVLEQMFQQQGLSIGDCTVGDTPSRRFAFAADPSSQGRRGDARGDGRDDGPGIAPVADADSAILLRRTSTSGRVDTFA